MVSTNTRDWPDPGIPPAPPCQDGKAHPLGAAVSFPPPPDDDACLALWEKYQAPEHIRLHSSLVACLATDLALAAREQGLLVDVQAVRAAGLLHDLAKAYTIRHKGSHAQLGAAWVAAETGHPLVAQGVAHHVWWPWEVDVWNHFLPMCIIYADKRVQHDRIVSMESRYQDLLARYGTSAKAIEGVERSHRQALAIRQGLTTLLGFDPDARVVDCGRLVQRT